jgi:RHS repeat-associated protein
LQSTVGSTGGPPAGSTYTTTYTYDDADQLTKQTTPSGANYQFFYDTRGNLRGTQYPNTTFSWDDIDALGQLKNHFNRHGSITAATTTAPADANGSPIADYSYTYTLDGQRSQETRTFGTTAGVVTGYAYDSLGRLEKVTRAANDCTAYSYDADSTRTQIRTSTAANCATFTTASSYAYATGPHTPVDALTSVTPTGGSAVNYSYEGGGTADGDGHVTGRGANTFTWDGLGRLKSAVVGGNSACYTFGPDGALRTRLYDAGGSTTCATATTTRNYLLGGSFETNASGTILTSYDDGPAGDLTSFNGPPTPSSTATYLYYNGHGDLAAEVTGATIVTHTYDAWGTPLDAPPANTTTHRYTGAWDKQYDTTTSLVLMGARPYDPATGRFLAIDPIDGGSLNNYDYAGQDPVNGYDLDGLSKCIAFCSFNGLLLNPVSPQGSLPLVTTIARPTSTLGLSD